MQKKKETLSVNYENDFAIIGIACHLNYYRVAHFMNKISNFNFTRYEDFLIYQKNNETPLGFPFYYFNDVENYTTFHLIANRSLDGIMINEWKQMDYLLIVFGASANIDMDSILKQIRKIPIVLAVSEMPFTKKLGIENLICDLELHFIEISKKEKEAERELMNRLRINRQQYLYKSRQYDHSASSGNH